MKEVAVSLNNAVEEARPWLLRLSEEQVRFKPTPDRWSIAEVIGHLIDSACNNHQRFVRAQKVEQLTFPKYEQNDWVAIGNYHSSDWQRLVELWYLYNRQLSHLIAEVPEDQLATPCQVGEYDTCTLNFLIEDYLDHLNHHLTKIRERLVES